MDTMARTDVSQFGTQRAKYHILPFIPVHGYVGFFPVRFSTSCNLPIDEEWELPGGALVWGGRKATKQDKTKQNKTSSKKVSLNSKL